MSQYIHQRKNLILGDIFFKQKELVALETTCFYECKRSSSHIYIIHILNIT